MLWAPKGGNDESEWEDGYATNAGNGIVALADGAGDGIFSKLWADLLLKSFVALPIPLDDAAAVEPWIAAQRRAWLEAIRYPDQRWSIQMKIDRSCGAATFVGAGARSRERRGRRTGPGDRLERAGPWAMPACSTFGAAA